MAASRAVLMECGWRDEDVGGCWVAAVPVAEGSGEGGRMGAGPGSNLTYRIHPSQIATHMRMSNPDEKSYFNFGDWTLQLHTSRLYRAKVFVYPVGIGTLTRQVHYTLEYGYKAVAKRWYIPVRYSYTVRH